MIPVPFFKQDTGYSCGPTALQMVFAFYGKRLSEEELIQRLQTKREDGTKHGPLIHVANEEGFYVYVNNDSSIEEIALIIGMRIPIIVHFIEPSEDEGHYAVVVGTTEREIILNDSWNGKWFRMDRNDFTKRWRSKDGDNNRWIMAISENTFSLGRQYMPE